MKEVWDLYGKAALRILAVAVVAAGLFLLICRSWSIFNIRTAREACSPLLNIRTAREACSPLFGAVSTEITEVSGAAKTGGEPELYAQSVRVAQGERIEYSSLAAAKDVDGSVLNSEIRFADAEGGKKTGVVDTSEPGCYPLFISVRSAISGRKVQKKIMILVDGRL